LKNIFTILFLLIFHCAALAQPSINISITFGSYYNDHHEKKFHAQERIWDVCEQRLIYRIDANGTMYADSLVLAKKEIEEVIQFIKDHGLQQSDNNELKSEYASKFEYSCMIRGSIEMQGKTYNYNIRSNASSLLEKYPLAKSLMDMEQLFYRLVENHR
jgi:hypothetical protein